MTPELTLPAREILVSHVISSLNEYWEENNQSILRLEIPNYQDNFRVMIPLKLVAIDLPEWANFCGIENQILVPQECVNKNESSVDWRRVDWWLAIFLMMEGWHERIWENIHGCIHSYSYRLRNWDSRVWDHAWVNRISLFLRAWYSEGHNAETEFFGCLRKPNLILSHDVDAVCKTHSIRIKQSFFHVFNSLALLFKFRIKDSFVKFKSGFKFFLGREDWWIFDKLLQIEENSGISAIYHFYSDDRPKNFRRWLMDPNYDVNSDRLRSLFRQLKDAGHKIGLHPTYDSWFDSKLLKDQKKKLEDVCDSKIRYCRQHWLRFSWKDTWRAQGKVGLETDSTLMFNDRSGFRNSCATSWKPWDQLEGKAHKIMCFTSVLMDSHLYDYNNFTCNQRKEYLRFWIKECREVCGTAFLLWHPQTLTRDYGWETSFRYLIEELE